MPVRCLGGSRRIGAALLLGALAFGVSGCEWVTLGYNASRTGYNSAESTIGTGNVSTLHEVWSAAVGSGPTDQAAAWSPVVGPNAVFVGTKDGVLRAFDRDGTTGCAGTPKICQPLWTATVGGGPLTPTVVGGRVYVTANNTLYTFDASGTQRCAGAPKTCQPLWTAAPAIDSPVVVNGVLYASTGTTVAAFDAAGVTGCSGTPKTCQPLWSSQPAGCAGVSTECKFSAPSVSGGKVYAVWAGNFEFGQAYLQAFDAAGQTECTGTPKQCAPLWRVFIKGNQATPAPVIAEGRVFVFANFVDTISDGSPGAWLEAHDAASGALLWDSKFFGTFTYTPVVANGRLYVAAGHVRVFDPTAAQGCAPHGSSRRCNGLFDLTTSELTATATIANGVLYDGSVPSFFEFPVAAAVRGYAISALTPACNQFDACAPLWKTPDLGGATSAVVVNDGSVYVATAEGKLHVYSLP